MVGVHQVEEDEDGLVGVGIEPSDEVVYAFGCGLAISIEGGKALIEAERRDEESVGSECRGGSDGQSPVNMLACDGRVQGAAP